MEITITLTLPVSKLQRLTDFLKSLDEEEAEAVVVKEPPELQCQAPVGARQCKFSTSTSRSSAAQRQLIRDTNFCHHHQPKKP